MVLILYDEMILNFSLLLKISTNRYKFSILKITVLIVIYFKSLFYSQKNKFEYKPQLTFFYYTINFYIKVMHNMRSWRRHLKGDMFIVCRILRVQLTSGLLLLKSELECAAGWSCYHYLITQYFTEKDLSKL